MLSSVRYEIALFSLISDAFRASGVCRRAEIGKAITRSDGMCAWLKNQKSESFVFTHKRVPLGLVVFYQDDSSAAKVGV